MRQEDSVPGDEAPRTELTPVHQRTSRRLQGASPEFGLLPASTRASRTQIMTSTMTQTDYSTPGQFMLLQPRTPPIFNGDVFEDGEDWLDLYERVADFNGWNEVMKRREVYFSLDHHARTWFENHDREFPTWDEFRTRFLAAYAGGDRKEKAEAALHVRNQGPNESVAMYCEDMSRLFRRADPSMAEDKKLRHLMRGVKQELFAGLVRHPPQTVAEFIAEATTMEKTLQQRARQYNRNTSCGPSDVLSAALATSQDALRELIRSVVREELRMSQLPTASPACASLGQVVREEIRQAVGERVDLNLHPSALRTATYAQVLQQPSTCAAASVAPPMSPPTYTQLNGAFGPRQPAIRRTQPAYQGTLRKTDVWRAPDRTPLCYHCGEAGHLYRMCPYRRAGLRGFHPDAPCPRNGERPREIREYLSRQPSSPVSNRPDVGPAPSFRYRSPSPHRLSGSPGRRSPSPRREN